MTQLALVPKEDGFIKTHKLKKYIHSIPSKGNVVFKDSFSSIENGSLGIESVALDDVKEDRLSVIYPIINPAFLAKMGSSWEAEKVSVITPFFAVYSLTSPVCTLAVKKYAYNPARSKVISPKNIPQQISSQLLKAFRIETNDGANGVITTMLGVFSDHDDGVLFTSKFKGLIPSSVKKKIKEAKKYFNKNIFVIAEAEWESDIIEIGDPLVIGIHKNICYLISEFDTTPMEELVVKNYVKKKK